MRKWRPLSLYWRRRRKAPARMFRRNAARPAITRVTWFPQFHFHFATHITTNKSGGQAILPVLLRSIETRTGRHDRTDRTFRTSTYSYFAQRLFDRTNTTLQKSSTSLVHHSKHIVFRAISTQTIAQRSSIYREIARIATRQVLQKEMRAHTRELATLRFRERDHFHTKSIASSLPIRPPELVWRRERQLEKQRMESAAENPRVIPSPASFRAAVAEAEVAQQVRPMVARAATQTTSIDPALIDRLTEDVIRRVEKRARIERERRGL